MIPSRRLPQADLEKDIAVEKAIEFVRENANIKDAEIFFHVLMAHTRVVHDKKQDLAHIADILLFEELGCFM